jgi:hypothetical protein
MFEYKMLDEQGKFIGFKQVDIVKNSITYLNAVRKEIKKPTHSKIYLQQYVTSIGPKNKKTHIYSGDVLSMCYGTHANYDFKKIVGHHDRIKAFKLFDTSGSRSTSIGCLREYVIKSISNVVESCLLLALKENRFDIGDYVIEEVL